MNKLEDSYGRSIKKLRISVTDRCNMRCIYCMPKNVKWLPKDNILTYEEIARLAAIFANLGIEKIRLTGGEPLLRPRIDRLVEMLKKIKGIKSVSMTTNGLLLNEKIEQLKKSDLDSINISLDTLRDDRFKTITGSDGLKRILKNIEIANNYFKIKINTVIIRGYNDDEVLPFVNFAKDNNYTVRFIEFMPFDGKGIWKPELVVSKEEMLKKISSVYDIIPIDSDSRDPAKLYEVNHTIIGFISSITEPFCNNCDRIRLMSDGRLLTCLFDNIENAPNLKPILNKSKKEIAKFIIECVKNKQEGVISQLKRLSSMNAMHSIGG